MRRTKQIHFGTAYACKPQETGTLAQELRLHTAGVTGSIPVAPTIHIKGLHQKKAVPTPSD